MNENSDDFIIRLFHGKCIICKKPFDEINEIIPRSQDRDALRWKNRVTLCKVCHRQYHDLGTSDEAIQNMQEKRKQFLITIGREEYV